MSGLNIPTGSTQSVTGPAGGGQLQTSALNQILGLGTSGMALLNQPYINAGGTSSTPIQSILQYLQGQPKDQAAINASIASAGLPQYSGDIGSNSFSLDPFINIKDPPLDYTDYLFS